MTVSTTTNRKVYTGDGSTTVFAFPYKYIVPADLVVYVNNILQVSGYTASTPTDSGGNITFSAAPANSSSIVILSSPSVLQSTALPSTGPFPAKSVETALDKLTLLVQRQADLNSRSLHLSDSDTTTADVTLPSPAPNKLLGWNSTATGFQNLDPTSLATIVAFGTAAADIFTGTGAQTVFVLSANPGAQFNLDVAIGGVTQLPGVDYTWSSGTNITFTVAPALGVKVLVRYMQALPQGVTDSGSTSFTQDGVGAVARSARDKLIDQLPSAQDFGAAANNIADDAPSINAALATGRSVFLKNGLYKINSPLVLAFVGQKLIGESMNGVYLLTAAASTHDMVRVAASLCEVSGILFRPGSVNNVPLRVYASGAHINKNRFLSASPGLGYAIVLTDQNPLGGTVSGAYTHVLDENHFGATGYNFATDIVDASVNGITSTKFLNNNHLCDRPFQITNGGGNTYFGNLYQSATGTAGTKVGNGLDFGANVYGEMVFGNYFELFTNAILTRAATNTYQSFYSSGNHFDNNTNNHNTTLGTNYVAKDTLSLVDTKNGWTDNYSSQTTRTFNGLSGGTAILTLDETNKAVKTNKKISVMNTLSYTADGQTQQVTSEYMIITGAGAARINCVLGNTGAQDGQRLVLLGPTWAVTLGNTNIRFASLAASATFGNTAGQVQAMEFIYYAALSRWYEVCRTIT